MIKQIKINDLVSSEENPRRITSAARDNLRKKIERFGHVGTIVARKLKDGTLRIVSGHQRVSVMKEMGKDLVDCHIIECSDKDERALLVALNGHDGEWEKSSLSAMLEKMKLDGENISMLGIDDVARNLIKSAEETPSLEIKSVFEVVVSCVDEEEQQAVYEQLTEEGKTCRILSI